MIRGQIQRHYDHDPLFRWRGENVTRIENLSDIVFALAFGMLVSASSPPTTYSSLLDHLWQIIPVIAGFAILVVIWNAHFVYFRRYAVADRWVITLNAALLLVVLFIAYPLRFIFDGLFGFLLGAIAGDWSRMQETGMGYHESGHIVGIFAAGYAMTFAIIALLYGHALRKKHALDLNANELALTRRSVWIYWGSVGLSLMVTALAFWTQFGPFASWLYALTGLIAFIANKRFPLEKVAETEA